MRISRHYWISWWLGVVPTVAGMAGGMLLIWMSLGKERQLELDTSWLTYVSQHVDYFFFGVPLAGLLLGGTLRHLFTRLVAIKCPVCGGASFQKLGPRGRITYICRSCGECTATRYCEYESE